MKKVWYAWENPNKYHDVHVWYGYDKIYERNFKKLKLFIRKTLLIWWQFGKSEKGNDEPSTCTLNPTFFFVCMPQRFTSIRTPGHRQEAGSHPIHPVCIWTKQFWLFLSTREIGQKILKILKITEKIVNVHLLQHYLLWYKIAVNYWWWDSNARIGHFCGHTSQSNTWYIIDIMLFWIELKVNNYKHTIINCK